MTSLSGLPGWRHQAEQERKELGEPGTEQPEVVAGGGEDDVDGVAVASEQEVAAEMAVSLHVADEGLDGSCGVAARGEWSA